MSCHICGSDSHAWCGFCRRCKEHTVGVLNDDGEALSECCGAPGNAYDVEPPEPLTFVAGEDE